MNQSLRLLVLESLRELEFALENLKGVRRESEHKAGNVVGADS